MWISPNTAVQEAAEGKHKLVFATRLNLEMLGKSKTVAQAIQHLQYSTSTVHCVLPTMLRKGLDIYLTIPETAGYGKIAEPLRKMMRP